MTGGWIQKLAEDRLSRERQLLKDAEDELARRKAFEAALQLFWQELTDELVRVVKEYNDALGRPDLIVEAQAGGGRDRFGILSGPRTKAYCRFQKKASEQKLVVETGGLDHERKDHTDINFTLHASTIKAERAGDGSPGAVVEQVLSGWLPTIRDAPASG